TAPASSAIFACSGVTTSMMTPPLSIWARPFLVAQVEVSTVIGGGFLRLLRDPVDGVWAKRSPHEAFRVPRARIMARAVRFPHREPPKTRPLGSVGRPIGLAALACGTFLSDSRHMNVGRDPGRLS